MHIEKINNENHLLEQLHIQHPDLSAKIYPNLGGSLQELIVRNTGLIDGISNDSAGLEDYFSTYKSSVLFPFPNRIRDGIYKYGGHQHQFPVNEPSVNNAIHGLIYNKEFEVSSLNADKDKATVVLTCSSDGDEPGFPFQFDLSLIYTLSSSGKVSLEFKISNRGKNTFPYGLGWHPYFLSDKLEQAVLSFPSKDYFACDERSIPTETQQSSLSKRFSMAGKKFDDAYSLEQGICSFTTTTYTLNLSFDAADETYLQVYTPPHGRSIALEPMTCIANSFNNQIGLMELHPGHANTWKVELDVNMIK